MMRESKQQIERPGADTSRAGGSSPFAAIDAVRLELANLVRRNPKASMGLGLALGIALSRLLSR